ncbi:MAG TPA: acyltransferase [Candidatus Limnocylindrales bacterium]|nr:acyltransferase [Candidatus Limnocylindrales bacterium]
MARTMPRVPALDGLRAVAAVLVFVHHVQLPGIHPATIGLDVGVMLFFALSGYLLYTPFIAHPVEDGHGRSAAAFLVRRTFRIYPAYLVALAGSAWLYGWEPSSLLDVVTFGPSSLLVAWTLRVELAFYLLLPVVVFAMRGAPARVRVRVLLAGAAVSLLAGLLALATEGVVSPEWPAWLFAFVPGMLVGELVVARHPALHELARIRWLAVGVALLAASALPNLVYADIPGAVGAAILIAWCVARPAPGERAARAMVGAGALAYGVYLWHLPIIDAFRTDFTWGSVVLVSVLTLATAAVTYVLVESPGMRAGARLSRRIQARGTLVPAPVVALVPATALTPEPVASVDERPR